MITRSNVMICSTITRILHSSEAPCLPCRLVYLYIYMPR